MGVSNLERSSIDHVEYSIMVHAHSSNYEGSGQMFEFTFILLSAAIVCLWLVVGGEGDE